MKLSAAFLGVGMDIPFHLYRLPFFSHRVTIGGRSRLPGLADHHIRTMNVKTGLLTKFKLVSEGEFYAITLISSDHKGLNPLVLKTVSHRAWVTMTIHLSGFGIFGLLFPHLIDVFRQDIHVARIVIKPLIEANLGIDGRNIIFPDRSTGRTISTTR